MTHCERPRSRFLWVTWRSPEDTALAFAHCERKGREYIGYKVEVENLQRENWQRNSGEHRQPDHQHLGQVARQEIGREAADVSKNNPPFPDCLYDGWKGVVEENHGSGLSCHICAPQSHGNPDVRLPQCRSVIDTVASHRDDFAGGLIGSHEVQLFRRAHTRKDPEL